MKLARFLFAASVALFAAGLVAEANSPIQGGGGGASSSNWATILSNGSSSGSTSPSVAAGQAVQFPNSAGNPSNVALTGQLYGKVAGGHSAPFWEDEAGTVTQLGSGGSPSGWSYASPNVTLSTITDQVGIGISPVDAGSKLEVIGDATNNTIQFIAGAGGSVSMSDSVGSQVTVGPSGEFQLNNSGSVQVVSAGNRLTIAGGVDLGDSGFGFGSGTINGKKFYVQDSFLNTFAPMQSVNNNLSIGGVAAVESTLCLADGIGGINTYSLVGTKSATTVAASIGTDGTFQVSGIDLAIASITSNTLSPTSSFTYDNSGALAASVVQLPRAAPGCSGKIFIIANQYVKVLCPAPHVLYLGSTSSTAGGYWASNTPGSSITVTLCRDGLTWIASDYTGTWNANSEP